MHQTRTDGVHVADSSQAEVRFKVDRELEAQNMNLNQSCFDSNVDAAFVPLRTPDENSTLN